MILKPEDLLRKPKIGLVVIVDPRVPDEVRKDITRCHDVAGRLGSLELDIVGGEEMLEDEEQVGMEIARLRQADIAGLVIYPAWFLRSNAVARAAQESRVPVFLWAQPDKKTASIVGLGVSHGALEELGVKHRVLCGGWERQTQSRLHAWAKASHVRQCFSRARYGQCGARCLNMLPADADANQWRWKFGIDVEQAEQWTLIHKAQLVDDKEAMKLVKEWKGEFLAVECKDESLLRSAKIYIAGKRMFAEHNWTFAGLKCQFELIDNYVAPCLPVSLWNDEGIMVACESDMNAAITMFALYATSGSPVMFSDVSFVDMDKSIVRFLNCGAAATKLAGGRDKVRLSECPSWQSTFDRKSGKYLCQGGACTGFLLPKGRVTLARFGRIKGEYVLHVTGGEVLDYEHDPSDIMGAGGAWPFAYVRPDEPIDEFFEHLRAHHICISYGDWQAELKELAELLDIAVL